MIKYQYINTDLKSITVKGHANQNEYGNDIICASVSTAIIMTCNLISLFDQTIKPEIEEGFFHLKLTKKDQVIDKIIENLIYTLEDLEKQYPKYIKKT